LQSSEVDGAVDETYIVSAQSPIQRELISEQDVDVPLYVEGGFTTWLRDKSLTYFILRGEQTQRFRIYEENKEKDKEKDGNVMFRVLLFLII